MESLVWLQDHYPGIAVAAILFSGFLLWAKRVVDWRDARIDHAAAECEARVEEVNRRWSERYDEHRTEDREAYRGLVDAVQASTKASNKTAQAVELAMQELRLRSEHNHVGG